MKKFVGVIIIFILMVIMQPTQVEAGSDFYISDGVLKAYTGKSKVVTIPSNVHTIGYEAFEWNELEELIIPKNVVTIDNRAFFHCEKLKTVKWEEGTKNVGLQAFAGCKSLNNIKIPNSVISVSANILEDTLWLKNKSMDTFAINNHVLIKYHGKDSEVTIPKKVKIIAGAAFWGKEYYSGISSIKKVNIGSNVERIERYAFSDCINLKFVNLSEGLKYIGEGAFSNCSKLIEIKLPDTLEEIDNLSFNETGLQSLVIPENVIKIGSLAFDDCRNLSSVEFNNEIAQVSGVAFKGTPWFMNLEYTGDYLILHKTIVKYIGSSKKVVIPDNINLIGHYAFSDNNSINSLVIPSTVKKIDYGAFSGCKNLGKVTLKSGIEVIEPRAFDNTTIEKITIPGTVNKFHLSSFGECKKLKTIIVSEGVKAIGDIGMTGLKNTNVYFPKSLKYFYDNLAYAGENKNVTFYAYKKYDAFQYFVKFYEGVKLKIRK